MWVNGENREKSQCKHIAPLPRYSVRSGPLVLAHTALARHQPTPPEHVKQGAQPPRPPHRAMGPDKSAAGNRPLANPHLPHQSDGPTQIGPKESARGGTHSAVHLVAGSTTSPVQAQIARSELARPLVNASVERISRANHVFTCILLQSSISHRLFGCIRSVCGSASYGAQGHSGNARMQTYADAQQARASSPVLSTRCFCDFCTLALGHSCRGACIKSSTGVEVLHEYRVFTLSSPFSAT